MYASGTLSQAVSIVVLTLSAAVGAPVAAQSALDAPQRAADDAGHLIRGPSAVPLTEATQHTDTLITAAVKASLSTNTEGQGIDVDVQTRDGRVTLLGMVGSEAAQDRASLLTRRVHGVAAVDNQLMVVRGTPTLIRVSSSRDEARSLFMWPLDRYERYAR